MQVAGLDSPRPDRHHRRRAETRRRLLEATRRLFATRGYHATRPQDIAREADVGTGTFYLHFADKREAFLAFTDEASRELSERVHASLGPAATFRERMAAAIGAVLDFAAENPGVLPAAFAEEAVAAGELRRGEGMRDRLAQRLATALAEAMKRGEISNDFDEQIIAHGIVGLVQHAVSYVGHTGGTRKALLRNLSLFCASALEPRRPELKETKR